MRADVPRRVLISLGALAIACSSNRAATNAADGGGHAPTSAGAADGGAAGAGGGRAPILDGPCFAAKLWGRPLHEALTRRMMRGLTGWMMAMERQPNDPAGPILARSHYPVSIVSHDGGREIAIDYAAARPGKPGGG